MGLQTRDTFYIIGTVAGPHPYPMMVRDFQAIVGFESRKQILEKREDFLIMLLHVLVVDQMLLVCFHTFLEDKELHVLELKLVV